MYRHSFYFFLFPSLSLLRPKPPQAHRPNLQTDSREQFIPETSVKHERGFWVPPVHKALDSGRWQLCEGWCDVHQVYRWYVTHIPSLIGWSEAEADTNFKTWSCAEAVNVSNLVKHCSCWTLLHIEHSYLACTRRSRLCNPLCFLSCITQPRALLHHPCAHTLKHLKSVNWVKCVINIYIYITSLCVKTRYTTTPDATFLYRLVAVQVLNYSQWRAYIL